MNERTITLILTSPTRGETKISCDPVRFSVPDGETNRNAGGSVGIRRGHAYALMAVAELLTGDFPHLNEYLRDIRKELE